MYSVVTESSMATAGLRIVLELAPVCRPIVLESGSGSEAVARRAALMRAMRSGMARGSIVLLETKAATMAAVSSVLEGFTANNLAPLEPKRSRPAGGVRTTAGGLRRDQEAGPKSPSSASPGGFDHGAGQELETANAPAILFRMRPSAKPPNGGVKAAFGGI